MLGRKPSELGSGNSYVGFKVKEPKTVDKLKLIAKREGVQLKEIYNRAIEEYAERHDPGNTQTLLASYQPGGVKSEGQLEQEVRRYVEKHFKKRELTFEELLNVCKESGLGKPSVSANIIMRGLLGEGWRVWR